MNKKILIVDDEKDIRFILEEIFSENNYQTISKGTIKESIDFIDNNLFDIAFIDVLLDEKNRDGLYLLKYIKNKNKDIPVIMMSGHANIELAVNSVKVGAFEFLEKPFNQDRLLNFAKRASEFSELLKSKKVLSQDIFKSYELIGENKEIVKIKNLIEKVSHSEARILIEGNSGTGKELLAREIHKKSERSDENFVILDSSRLKLDNFEEILFGKVVNNQIYEGHLEKANNGTLFIDRINEISLEVQSKLLRILTDQKFKRLGSNTTIKVNFKLICSSSTELKREVITGNFREDLFHRINVINFYLPNLVDRGSDIPILCEYFYKKFKDVNANFKTLVKSYDLFYKHKWPGNVRELRNLVERIAILGNEDIEGTNKILYDHFSKEIKKLDNSNTENLTLKEARDNFEREYLITQLNKYDGNVSKTAEAIGMERSALHRKLSSLNIKN
jgi:two-component system nitrogen regulation response regulator NtrX